MRNLLERYYPFLFFILLAYMPIFGHLDTLPIRLWDESRLAINAFEMYENGNWLVPHFEGSPDMWNTKPPLLIWFQVIFMKLIGVGELALRLPSAFAALFTSFALVVFLNRYLQSKWVGLIAGFVLFTSYGFIDIHASRTGDYDALLTLFTTLGCLSLFAYIESKINCLLYFFFGCITLAVLTKSITGLLFGPGLLIYVIAQKELIPLLRNKHVYFSGILCLLFSLSYYIIREQYNPGYIQAVQENELGGRFLNTLEGHNQHFWMYFKNLIFLKLHSWILLIPCGIIIGLTAKDKLINRITLFSTIMAFSFLLIISISQTKLVWYDVPAYPFLAIIIAIPIYLLFELLRKSERVNMYLSFNIAPFLLLLFICIPPYLKILDKTYLPREKNEEIEFYNISYYLQDAVDKKINLDQHILIDEGYNPHNLFYVKILKKQGIQFDVKSISEIKVGDKVIVHQQKLKQKLNENYMVDLIYQKENIITYNIKNRKQ